MHYWLSYGPTPLFEGAFKASGHRVRRTDEQRFSIVLFVAAKHGIDIAPLPAFVAIDNPARYAPITQAQHIDNEVRRAKANAAARATDCLSTTT